MNITKFCCVILIVGVLGCTSLEQRMLACYDQISCSAIRGASQVFPGVERDLSGIAEGESVRQSNLFLRTIEIVVSVIDLPFSLIFDSVLFPIDLIVRDKREKIYVVNPSDSLERSRNKEIKTNLNELSKTHDSD